MHDATADGTSIHGTAAAAERGDLCLGCRRPLPIRAKRLGEVAAHWECAACRGPLTGVLIKEEAMRIADAIRIGQVHFDTAKVPPFPTSLRQLVREFAACRRDDHAPNQRTVGQRVPAQIDVTILPLDESWTPRSKPLIGLVVDLTSHGLGMVTPTPLEGRHVGLQMRPPAGIVQILGEVVWTKELGMGFHNSGVQFLLRFGRTAVGSATT